jgi:Sigma-70, region 4
VHSAHEIVADIMRELADRDRSVLERRYGFLTGRIETLEEIALDYRLTRERIRQIEAKTLRRIGRSKLGKRLRLAFDQEISGRLMAATDNLGFIRHGETSQVLHKLPAADRFAIDLLYEGRDKFLGKFARHWHGDWILPPFAKEELQELLRQVKARLASVCLPAAFRELTAGMPETSVRTAIGLGTDLSIVEGYLIAGRAGTRPLRTIRLHRCLVEAAGVLEVGDLVRRYRQTAQNDRYSSVRDAMIVMIMAPHLFLGVFDRHWYGLGEAGHFAETPRPGDAPPEVGTNEAVATARPDEEGIRAVLRQILLEKGPLRFVDLRERASRRLRGKSWHSVGPVLLTSGEFVRPLPGVYAVPEQIPAASAVLYDPPAFLLAEEQVRYLAVNRH